ncbi:hypothetical protein ABTH30_20530, partial [Acinetobacter baumannii]
MSDDEHEDDATEDRPRRTRRSTISPRTALIALACLSAAGVIGTITATAFAVRHYEDWAAVADQRDDAISTIADLE